VSHELDGLPGPARIDRCRELREGAREVLDVAGAALELHADVGDPAREVEEVLAVDAVVGRDRVAVPRAVFQ
jgi:hypothetical protein